MTQKEFTAIKAGDQLIHKHFGVCLLKEIKYTDQDEFFGMIIVPQTDKGKVLLYHCTGTPIGTPLLECSLNMVRPLNRPFKEVKE